MSFTAPHFYVLLFVTFSLYWLIPSQLVRRRFLLVGSFLFYSLWNFKFFALLLVSTTSDYLAARLISRSEGKRTRLAILCVTLAINFGLLAYFKYVNFFLHSASGLLRLGGHPGFDLTLDVVLPLGISFYTFHTVSYAIDVYRRKTEPITNFWDYFLFVCYFPQLVAGPIARVTSLYPQFFERHRLELRRVADSLLLISFGIFLKFLFADELGGVADVLFDKEELNATLGWTAVFSFGYQIYLDFWAYTLIARGSSRLFGIELNLNFAQPYLSATPSEFWRRWHISLSSWFRDYVYIPLGGNQARVNRNLLLTMTLAGLWHGSSALFLLWGLYHGLLLVAFRYVRLPAVVTWPVTFLLVQLGWILFRAKDLAQAAKVLRSLWSFGPTDPAFLAPVQLTIGIVALTMLIDLGFRLRERSARELPYGVSFLKLSCASALVLIAVYLGETGATPFIYFNF